MKKESNTYKYVHYKESDFLTDSRFLEWVYQPSADNEAFWQEVIATLPQQQATIAKARLYLQSVTFAHHQPTEAQVNASWEKHLQQIQALPQATPKVRRISRGALLAAAAVVSAFVLIGGYWLFNQPGTEQITASTRFGETREVTLPDGSLVHLNANSSLTYKNRELWLKGEALFTVQPAAGEAPFLVHTKDITVTVLGTVFDVRQRREKTEVVLESGKIRLSFPHRQEKDIIMTPGQLVAYNPSQNSLITSTTAPEKYSAWKQQRLILQDPKVRDILIYLEDNFGKKILLDDEEMYNRTVNGPILISTLDDALFVLSSVLNTTVVKRDSTTIELHSREEQ